VLILPAIDIRGGQCVRLRQGDYERETVFGADPAAMARRWVEQGATFLHLVDLDGAREGHPVNEDSVRRIIEAAEVPSQLGGGLRSEEYIERALSWGVSRVVLGTRALQDPAWCEKMTKRFPARIVLGVDARQGKIVTGGWLRTEELTALEAARHCATWRLAALVYTDIGRDGMLEGPDVAGTVALAKVVPFPVVASGGVGSLKDVERLRDAGVAACIIGRALYEGRVDLAVAIAKTKDV
jgi:phosphoribosylformimino-5-aminoimidazole carboxamide ribotide isomerase